MTKNDVINYLRTYKEQFAKKYQISKIVLFGSYARGENTENSDIDVAIETKLNDYFLLYDFKEELEENFQTKVDVIRLRDRMNSHLRKRIEKEGVHV